MVGLELGQSFTRAGLFADCGYVTSQSSCYARVTSHNHVIVITNQIRVIFPSLGISVYWFARRAWERECVTECLFVNMAKRHKRGR